MASSKNAVNDQRGAARETVRATQGAQRRQRSLIITSAAVEECITPGTHSGCVNQQTKAATSSQDGQAQAVVRFTPTVIADGKTLRRSSLADVEAAVEAVAR